MTNTTTGSHTQQYRVAHNRIRAENQHPEEPIPYQESSLQDQKFFLDSHLGQFGNTDGHLPQTSGTDSGNNGDQSTSLPSIPSSAELLSLYGPKPIRAQFACDYCRVRKAKCSGTEPCDRCISKKRLCTFSSVQNQRKVTRSLKDLRAERTNGSPCRSPASNSLRPLGDSHPQGYYSRVSGVHRDSPTSPSFRSGEVVGSSQGMNMNGRHQLSSPGSTATGWPYEWTEPTNTLGGNPNGFRRSNPPQPIAPHNYPQYLCPSGSQQMHLLGSPILDMNQSPISTSGHYYSAQSSPTFFQGSGAPMTHSVAGIGSTVSGMVGLGIGFNNAAYYAAIGQNADMSPILSHPSHQVRPRSPLHVHSCEGSSNGSDLLDTQPGWREGHTVITPSNRYTTAAHNLFSAGNGEHEQTHQPTSSSFNAFASDIEGVSGSSAFQHHKVEDPGSGHSLGLGQTEATGDGLNNGLPNLDATVADIDGSEFRSTYRPSSGAQETFAVKEEALPTIVRSSSVQDLAFKD